MSTPPRDLPTLFALSTGDAARALDGRLERAAGAALGAGLRGLVLREPDLEDGPFLSLAERLVALAAREGDDALVVLHDRVHLVSAAGAGAVHLGGASLAPAVARELLPPGVRIGSSAHVGDAPERHVGADWLFLAPVRRTGSKPVEPVGFEALASLARASALPVLGLGGMLPGDLALARSHGAHGIAVLSGILGSDDPAAATRAYLGRADAP